ncbi:hypothetical protein [Pseudomonas sp. HS6]|uniref:hypothetical protein n=1 Tax=Pseudomonas sp. HS6 TaxID=2850559 RepID=UPI0020195CFA|nr:hypothetical protein [Pseudomonas sp. HS6]UQS16822.1 hypothetical protein JJN09_08200 [Pseudomonas sp. HS6]
MLVIRDAQMAQMRRLQVEADIAVMANELREALQARMAVLPEFDLIEFVRTGWPQSERYGVLRRESIFQFLLLRVLFDDAFSSISRSAEIERILQRRDCSGEEKLTDLQAHFNVMQH